MERRPMRAEVDAPVDPRSMHTTLARPRWLPSLLGAFAGLLLCVGVLAVTRLFAPSPPPAPTAVANALCVDLTRHQYVDLHGLLTPPLAAQGSAQAFAAAQLQLDAMSGPVSSCAVVEEHTAGVSATLDLRLTRSSSSATVAVQLILIDGQWRISAYDSTWI